jgi:rod shape-determining protein MreD
VAALVAAAVLQSVALPHLVIFGVKVDLVLLVVVALSIRHGVQQSIVWALAGGAIVDLLSAGPFGTSVVAFGVAAVLAGTFGPSLRQASALLPLALTPLVSVVATVTAAFVMALLGWRVPWPSTVALVILPAAVLDSVAMLIVYPLVSAVDRG